VLLSAIGCRQTPPSRVPVNYCSGDYNPAVRLLDQLLECQ
jgi:hypothetical protein